MLQFDNGGIHVDPRTIPSGIAAPGSLSHRACKDKTQCTAHANGNNYDNTKLEVIIIRIPIEFCQIKSGKSAYIVALIINLLY